MKKILSSVLLFCILSNNVVADCDWTQIKKNPDNTYTYSEKLHLCVGQLVQDNKALNLQVGDLTKALTLKDLALTKSDERTQLWMNTSDQLTDRMTKIDEVYKHNEWLYFGLGVATTFLAGFAAAKLIGH